MALVVVYLIIISPITLAQEGEQSPEDAFSSDPSPENFNKLPNPTAADLEKVPNPTEDNFIRLNFVEQGRFMSKEANYQQDFANKYWSNPSNWGLNPEADKILFEGTRFRDLLRVGESQRNAAASHFKKIFNAPYTFLVVSDDFVYHSDTMVLKNNKKDLKLENYRGDPTIKDIISTKDGFEILRDDAGEKQKISVGGNEATTVEYSKGKFKFQPPTGPVQEFEVPSSAEVTFIFDNDKLTINGPAKGIANIDNDYAQFDNRQGTLIIKKNGDITANDAEVITSRLFADGHFEKKKNTIEAWDIGRDGKHTVIIDKTACPEDGACIGVSTQGQWDVNQLSAKDKDLASTLTIKLDEISGKSSFYVNPKKPPSDDQKTENARKQAVELRKPSQPPKKGNNAEVWINKDEKTSEITVTSKGVVEVGLYDARGSAASAIPNKFRYKGLNGLSELDVKFAGRTQTNVRGQAEFKNNQFREGVFTNQDGAVFKVTNDNFGTTQLDTIRADCFECSKGEAIVIKKTIAVATKVEGVFADADHPSVRLVVEVDENGEVKFEPKRQDLGILAKETPDENKEVSMGRNLYMSVPCGKLQCNFRMNHDPSKGDVGGAYEIIDPNTNQKVSSTTYAFTVGKVLGNEVIVVSNQNLESVNQLADIFEKERYSDMTKLSFDKSDPGYVTLRKKYLEAGINLDAVQDQQYAGQIGNIIKTTKSAQSVFDKYDIKINEKGEFKTQADIEKFQKLTKSNAGAVYDELTRAQFILAKNRVFEVESILKGCQETSYCSETEKDLKYAKSVEKQVLKIRQENYKRWTKLVEKEKILKELEAAKKRQAEKNKGIEETDKKELTDVTNKIKTEKNRQLDLQRTLEAQRNRFNSQNSLMQNWMDENVGGGKGSYVVQIDWNKFSVDKSYANRVISRLEVGDDEDFQRLYAEYSFEADNVQGTSKKLDNLDRNLNNLEQQNKALVTKYRWQGKDDVAAEVALLSGQYDAVNDILTGLSIAAEDGITEVVNLDSEGNVIDRIDVSHLAGKNLIPPEIAKDIANRAVKQKTEESLNEVALLYDYGYGTQASQMQNKLEQSNPEIKNTPEYRKAAKAQMSYSKRVTEQRKRDLEQERRIALMRIEDEKWGAQRDLANSINNWDSEAAGDLINGLATGNFGNFNLKRAGSLLLSSGDVVTGVFGNAFDLSEKAGAYVLGHAVAGEGLADIKDKLDSDALEEQNRQIQLLSDLQKKFDEYDEKGLTATQAMNDARKGITRDADGDVIQNTLGKPLDAGQILVGDDPEIAKMEFQMTEQPFTKEELEYADTLNPLEREAFLTKKQEAYQDRLDELEFDVKARDADNSLMFNRGKMVGEPESKMRAAIDACPTCSGAKIYEHNLKELDKNVLPEILSGVLPFDYVGDTFGEALGKGLGRIGITYTSRTEENFRDMVIASLDATIVFDIGGAVIGGPLAFVNELKKIADLKKGITVFEAAVDVSRYASKASREALKVAQAVERAATTAEAAEKAREVVRLAQAAVDAEGASRKVGKIGSLFNTPLGQFDRDIYNLKNTHLNDVADNTRGLSQARRDLDKARRVEDTVAEGRALRDIKTAQKAIQQANYNIDRLNSLTDVSKLAGSKAGLLYDNTLGKTIGVRDEGLNFGSRGEEVAKAEADFLNAKAGFLDAKKRVKLNGDSVGARQSRANLDIAQDALEQAAAKVEDAYINRGGSLGKKILKDRTLQGLSAKAERIATTKGDEIVDAVGVSGAQKLDDLAADPRVRIETEGTELRFAVDEDAPQRLRIDIDDANENILPRIDTTSIQEEAEAERVLLEALADSEYAAALKAKTTNLNRVTPPVQRVPDFPPKQRLKSLDAATAQLPESAQSRLGNNVHDIFDDLPIEEAENLKQAAIRGADNVVDEDAVKLGNIIDNAVNGLEPEDRALFDAALGKSRVTPEAEQLADVVPITRAEPEPIQRISVENVPNEISSTLNCPTSALAAAATKSSVSTLCVGAPTPDLPDRGTVQTTLASTPTRRQIDEGAQLERNLNRYNELRIKPDLTPPEVDELRNTERWLYDRATTDDHGALNMPAFENKVNKLEDYTLVQGDIPRDSSKGLNAISYEVGDAYFSAQHQHMVRYANENNLLVTTSQKTTYVSIPKGSSVTPDDVARAFKEAQSKANGAAKEATRRLGKSFDIEDPVIRVGIADGKPGKLMEARVKTKRSISYRDEHKLTTAQKYDQDVDGWYKGIDDLEKKAEANDIFRGYDKEGHSDDFKALVESWEKGEVDKDKLVSMARKDLQDANMPKQSVAKNYMNGGPDGTSATKLDEGDWMVSFDGIGVKERNIDDTKRVTKKQIDQKLSDSEIAEEFGITLDKNIEEVNKEVVSFYEDAVDNIGKTKPVRPEDITKYSEKAKAAGWGPIRNEEELKGFLKWEFQNRNRFRGGDEGFSSFRKIVVDHNPGLDIKLNNKIKQCGTRCGFDIRVGVKEIQAGESYTNAVSKADEAVSLSKYVGDQPIRVDKNNQLIVNNHQFLPDGKSVVESSTGRKLEDLEAKILRSDLEQTAKESAEKIAAKKIPEPSRIPGEEMPTRVPAEVPPQWIDEVNSPEKFAELRSDSLEFGTDIPVGDEAEFVIRDKSGKVIIEAEQTLKYNAKDNLFTFTVVDPKTNELIATHYYNVEGDKISIAFTEVTSDYQNLGINEDLFRQMSDLHPNADVVDTAISGTNKQVYREKLAERLTPLEAMEQTPAGKARIRSGWEIDDATLPKTVDELDALKDKPFQMVSTRKTAEVEIPAARKLDEGVVGVSPSAVDCNVALCTEGVTGKVDPDILANNKAQLGKSADNPIVNEALDELGNVKFKCDIQIATTGGAVGCNPSVIVRNSQQRAAVEKINKVRVENGEIPIRITDETPKPIRVPGEEIPVEIPDIRISEELPVDVSLERKIIGVKEGKQLEQRIADSSTLSKAISSSNARVTGLENLDVQKQVLQNVIKDAKAQGYTSIANRYEKLLEKVQNGESVVIPKHYHATPLEGLEGILDSQKIESRAESLVAGAWTSSRPEIGNLYGDYAVVMGSKIEKGKVGVGKIGTAIDDTYSWIGFADDIPLNQNDIAYVIAKDSEKAKEARRLLQQKGIDIDVLTLAEAEQERKLVLQARINSPDRANVLIERGFDIDFPEREGFYEAFTKDLGIEDTSKKIFDDLEHGEVLQIRNEYYYVTIEGDKKFLNGVSLDTRKPVKKQLVATDAELVEGQNSVEKLLVGDATRGGTINTAAERTRVKVNPQNVEERFMEALSNGEFVPLEKVSEEVGTATHQGKGIFVLDGTKYVYDPNTKSWTTKGVLGAGKEKASEVATVKLNKARNDILSKPISESRAVHKRGNVFDLDGEKTFDPVDGWTEPGFLGFGKIQVVDSETIAHLEAARLKKLANPKSLDDLQEGQHFRIKSKSGNYYEGKYLRESVDANGNAVIVYEFGEPEGGFLGFGKKRQKGTLKFDNLDQTTLTQEGKQIRIKTKDGKTYYGRYDGEDATSFKLTDQHGEQSIDRNDLDFDSSTSEGDEVMVTTNFGDMKVGRYIDENDDVVTLLVGGKKVPFYKNDVKMDTFGKAFDLGNEFLDNLNQFQKVARKESIGGNAGLNNLAVNFYVDSDTGRIIGVGNFQNLPEEITSRGLPMSVIVNFREGKIVDVVGNQRFLDRYKETLIGRDMEKGTFPKKFVEVKIPVEIKKIERAAVGYAISIREDLIHGDLLTTSLAAS